MKKKKKMPNMAMINNDVWLYSVAQEELDSSPSGVIIVLCGGQIEISRIELDSQPPDENNKTLIN